MKTMYGVITAMTTPFFENGEVDFESLEEQVEFLIQKGIHCLYPCGTTGEMIFMTNEQREAVAECVVKKAGGRVIVFIHVGAVRCEDALRLAKHAYAIGADGIGVVTPSFLGLTDCEIEEFYVHISNSLPVNFPIYLYNIPQCSCNDITPEVCERIAARCRNVVGIKYSWADMQRTLDYLHVRNGDFSVLVGADRLFLPALVIGCHGSVSGVSSVFPEPFVEVYNAYLQGDKKACVAALWKSNDIVKKLQGGSRLSVFKAAQKLRGLKGGLVHAPLLELTNQERNELKQSLQEYL